VHLHTESFSAVSSVSIDDVFSADYDNYLMVDRLTNSVGGQPLNVRLRSAGIDDTSAKYSNQFFAAYGSSTIAIRSTSQTTNRIGAVDTARSSRTTTITFPAVATVTAFLVNCGYRSGTNLELSVEHTAVATNAAYDGLTIFPASGNISGSIRIYGYRNT
jgi:hypothetical protein